MPFLKAGFNGRNTKTGIRGWTRHIAGKRFAPAELRRFDSGDYFWLGEHFLAWGENVVLGTHWGFTQTWPDELPQSALNLARKARPMAAKLKLPYPISANRYWASAVPLGWKRQVTYVTKEAKAYKEAVGWAAKQAGWLEPTDKPVEIASVTLVPKNGVVMNLDNCLKVTFDALNGVVYRDDRQIRRIRNVEYAEPDGVGGLIVEVAEFVAPTALERGDLLESAA